MRTFAKIMGWILLLLGIGGLLLGEESLLGFLNIDIVEDVIHIVTGSLLLWSARSERSARTVISTLGAIYLVVAFIGFFISSDVFGLLPHGYSVVDNVIHLAIGVLFLGAALVVKREDAASNAYSN